MKKLIFLVVTLFIITACVSPSVTTKTVMPTVSPSISPPVTAAPSATATETPRPTATLLYLTPPPTNAPTADVKDWAFRGLTSTSPDGQWVADTYLHELNIYHHTGWLLWEISYQTAHGKTWWGNYIRVYDWSSDSRYLYFSPYWGGDGGSFRSLKGTIGLWRLDITSGEVKEIVMRSEEKWNHVSIALLVDKDLLAYAKVSSEPMPVDLIIRNLDTREEIIRFQIGDDAFLVDSLTWSPDGKKIFYMEVVVDEYENNWPEVFRYILMMIDVDTGEKTLLLDMGDPGYYLYQSEESNIIKLEKAGYSEVCEIYNFDIYKKEFIGFETVTPDPKDYPGPNPCAPTPTPTP